MAVVKTWGKVALLRSVVWNYAQTKDPEPRTIIRLAKKRPNCCQHTNQDNSLLQWLCVRAVCQLHGAVCELMLVASTHWSRRKVRLPSPAERAACPTAAEMPELVRTEVQSQ